MIKIKKGMEPTELMHYRKLPDASYRNMHGAPTGKSGEDGSLVDVYSVVLNKLIEEQGSLCAYCMCRIPEKGQKATIEHIDPQSQSSPQKALEYKNMLAVCSGNREAHTLEDKSCDARRGNQPLSLNPLKAETLSAIRYKSNGIIYSEDCAVNWELDQVLNLNCKARRLPENRRKALSVVLADIQRRHPTGDIREYCRKKFEKYQKENPKTPFVGIIMDWLEKHSR